MLLQGKDPIEQMTEQVMKAMQRHAQGQDPPPEMATKETLTDIIRTATLEFLNQASNSTLGERSDLPASPACTTASPARAED